MIATATISAEKFNRVVIALAGVFARRLAVGSEWNFMIADGVEVLAWIPREDHLTLQLAEFDGPAVRTVTVLPGVEREFEIVSDGVTIGETHGPRAAMSIALEYLTAPLRANFQSVPDPCGV